MRIWRIRDQVIRLSFVFAAVIIAFVVARWRFVPKTFGDIGHYRAASLEQMAGAEIRYAGTGVCEDCHGDVVETKNASYHRSLACEVCHGPAAKHAEAPDEHRPAIPRKRGDCLYCHEYLPSRPTGFPQVVEMSHNPMQACTSCHSPHDPTPPRVPDSCSACHAQISRTKSISNHTSLECETCHVAAPEHRQEPRAHLPSKPGDRAFCGGCHARDAESAAEIPRIDMAAHNPRYLCWQCHYPHSPEGH